jgi:hypothetical protein
MSDQGALLTVGGDQRLELRQQPDVAGEAGGADQRGLGLGLGVEGKVGGSGHLDVNSDSGR